jgi:outer membrane protein assembly factor BamD (BamD/ComL family)
MEQGLIILDEMRQHYPHGTDEAWWLYGQLLEANSAIRDIRMALEYSRRLVREFPQSNLFEEAQRRIAYLERFFFNMR